MEILALLVFAGVVIWWLWFRPNHFVTAHGRVKFDRIKKYGLLQSRKGFTTVVPQLYDGTFATFFTKIDAEKIRSLVGPSKEIPFHEIVYLDPDIEKQPALKKFANKLKAGQVIYPGHYLALQAEGTLMSVLPDNNYDAFIQGRVVPWIFEGASDEVCAEIDECGIEIDRFWFCLPQLRLFSLFSAIESKFSEDEEGKPSFETIHRLAIDFIGRNHHLGEGEIVTFSKAAKISLPFFADVISGSKLDHIEAGKLIGLSQIEMMQLSDNQELAICFAKYYLSSRQKAWRFFAKDSDPIDMEVLLFRSIEAFFDRSHFLKIPDDLLSNFSEEEADRVFFDAFLLGFCLIRESLLMLDNSGSDDSMLRRVILEQFERQLVKKIKDVSKNAGLDEDSAIKSWHRMLEIFSDCKAKTSSAPERIMLLSMILIGREKLDDETLESIANVINDFYKLSLNIIATEIREGESISASA